MPPDHGQPAPAWQDVGCAARNRIRMTDTEADLRRQRGGSAGVKLAAEPQSLVLDPARTALIVIDMQNDFCAPQGWMGLMGLDLSAARALVGPINAVSAAARKAGVPVIWLNWGVRNDRLNLSPSTQHPFRRMGPGLAGTVSGSPTSHHLLEKDSWGAQVIDELNQEPGDIRVDKHRISGFWDTPLDSILRNLDVTTLLFAGVNADHCVLGTLMDANFHGYDTILLEDCTATSSPDFCLEATIHNVRFCFGFTTTSEALVEGLRQTAAA